MDSECGEDREEEEEEEEEDEMKMEKYESTTKESVGGLRLNE